MRSPVRRPLLVALAVTTSLGLAACGTSQPAADEPAEETSGSSAAAGPGLRHRRRRPHRRARRPRERVVVLEWQQIEDVLTLGVDPVGAADVAGYNTWDTAETLDADTTDVGMRGEPNLDAVFSTNPDLVIVEAERGAPLIKQLASYDVPVLVTTGADAEDPIAQMKETFSLIATTLGKEDEAEQVLAEFDQTVEDAAQQIADADLATTEFAFVDGYLDGSNVAVRPFGQGSFMGELGEAVGLTNVWEGEVDPAYGLGSTDIEGLTQIGDANLFFTSTESDTLAERARGERAVEERPLRPAGPGLPLPPGRVDLRRPSLR